MATNAAPAGAAKRYDVLSLPKPVDGNTDREEAAYAVAGSVANAFVLARFSGMTVGSVDLTECFRALDASAKRAQGGDLGQGEALLMMQASVLNGMFCALAERGRAMIGEHPEAGERYLRLALRAQNQVRATVETLGVLKNPPAVFARQANIANGPQQVNNGVRPASVRPREKRKNAPIELMPNAD